MNAGAAEIESAAAESSADNKPSVPKKLSPPNKATKRKAPKASEVETEEHDLVLSEWCKAHQEHQPIDMRKKLSTPLTTEEIKSAGRKADKDKKVPRPRNSFILYRSAYNQPARIASQSKKQNLLSSTISRSWNNETPQIKEDFRECAELEKKRFHQLYGDYKYTPRKKHAARKEAREQQSVIRAQKTGKIQKSRSKPQHVFHRAKGKRNAAQELIDQLDCEDDFGVISPPQPHQTLPDVPELSYTVTPATSQVATPEPGMASMYQGQGHTGPVYGTLPVNEYPYGYGPAVVSFPHSFPWQGPPQAHHINYVDSGYPHYIHPAAYEGMHGTQQGGMLDGGLSYWPASVQNGSAGIEFGTPEPQDPADVCPTQVPEMKPNAAIVQHNVNAQPVAAQACIDPSLLGMPGSGPEAIPYPPDTPSRILQDAAAYLNDDGNWGEEESCEADDMFPPTE